MSTTVTALEKVTAAKINAIAAKGYVTEATETVSNTSTGATERADASVAFTPVSGRRYKVTYLGAVESDTAADGVEIRLRWKHTAVVDLTGTSFRVRQFVVGTNMSARTDHRAILVGTFVATASTTITVVASCKRVVGAGNVKQNATVGDGLYFLVECVDA